MFRFISDIKKQVKVFKDVFTCAYQMQSVTEEEVAEKFNNPIPFTKCNVANLEYIHYDKLTKSMGIAFAAALPSNHIVVDDMFMSLSDNAKAFILLHEAGHVEYDHSKYLEEHYKSNQDVLLTRNKMMKKGEVMDIEQVADKFAADRIGIQNSIKALEEMYRTQYEIMGTKNKEVLLRIDILKKYL